MALSVALGCQPKPDAGLQALDCSNQFRSLSPLRVLRPWSQVQAVLLIDAHKQCGDRLITPESATFTIVDDEGVELPNTVTLEPDMLGTRFRLNFQTLGQGRVHVTGAVEPTMGVFRATWPVAKVESIELTADAGGDVVRWPGGRRLTLRDQWRLQSPDGGTVALPLAYLYVPAETSYWVVAETARRFSYEGVELASTGPLPRQFRTELTLPPVAATSQDELVLVTDNGLEHFSSSGERLATWRVSQVGWMEFVGPRRLRLIRQGRVEEAALDDLDKLPPADFLTDTTVWHTDEGVWMTSPSSITLLRPDGGMARMPAVKGLPINPFSPVLDRAPVLGVGESESSQTVFWLPADQPDAGLTGRFVTDFLAIESATTSTVLRFNLSTRLYEGASRR